MAALCCISNLNLLEESYYKPQSQSKVVGESVQTGYCDLAPLACQTSHSCLLTPLCEMRRKLKGKRCEKIMRCDNFTGKAKTVHNESKVRNSATTSHQQADV